MRISYWSSDVCSSDLHLVEVLGRDADAGVRYLDDDALRALHAGRAGRASRPDNRRLQQDAAARRRELHRVGQQVHQHLLRSEEHTSELQSLMRNSYAVFCLKKTNFLNSIPSYHIIINP